MTKPLQPSGGPSPGYAKGRTKEQFASEVASGRKKKKKKKNQRKMVDIVSLFSKGNVSPEDISMVFAPK